MRTTVGFLCATFVIGVGWVLFGDDKQSFMLFMLGAILTRTFLLPNESGKQ